MYVYIFGLNANFVLIQLFGIYLLFVQVDRMGQTLDKMSTRVDELTIQGEALGSQRKEFNELHAETVSWLEAIENNAQGN